MLQHCHSFIIAPEPAAEANFALSFSQLANTHQQPRTVEEDAGLMYSPSQAGMAFLATFTVVAAKNDVNGPCGNHSSR